MTTSDAQTRAINISLVVAVVMLVGKVSAAWITGSDAIMSDAAESMIHIVATGVAALSIRIAARPADSRHPYGQGKISYLSAGAEGTLIILAAVAIFIEAGRSLIQGPRLQSLGIGLVITAVLAVINLGLGLYLVRTGRRHRSLILIANGEHVMTDMWTSVAVLVGVAVVWLTNVLWLDPVIAILAGANIVRSGGALVGQAYDGLMDRADPEDTELLGTVLKSAIDEQLIVGFHQLRHRTISSSLAVEVHLLLPDTLTLAEAHRRASEVERRVEAMLVPRSVLITTHLEPASHEDHHEGHLDVPLARS